MLCSTLGLQNGEHLELECGEDVDTVQNGPDGGIAAETRLIEQIKARSGRSLTLKGEEALQALSNFCSHRAANPTSNLKFRYITTANSGDEHGWGRTEFGIETWTALRRGRYDDATRREAIAALRTFLKSCARPEKASAVVWRCLQHVLASEDDTHLTEVILAFEWGIGCGDYLQSENEILAALTRDGHKMTPEEKKNYFGRPASSAAPMDLPPITLTRTPMASALPCSRSPAPLEVPKVDKVSFIFNFFDELRRKVPPGKN
jgi:hypothetical protein